MPPHVEKGMVAFHLSVMNPLASTQSSIWGARVRITGMKRKGGEGGVVSRGDGMREACIAGQRAQQPWRKATWQVSGGAGEDIESTPRRR